MSLFMHLARGDYQFGQPEQVAGVVAMLASADGAFMSGEIVRIDGGVHA
jgi:NAD(P)-dependent dehydrogenase (short-subunit alcohol dehydrogenase family)